MWWYGGDNCSGLTWHVQNIPRVCNNWHLESEHVIQREKVMCALCFNGLTDRLASAVRCVHVTTQLNEPCHNVPVVVLTRGTSYFRRRKSHEIVLTRGLSSCCCVSLCILLCSPFPAACPRERIAHLRRDVDCAVAVARVGLQYKVLLGHS